MRLSRKAWPWILPRLAVIYVFYAWHTYSGLFRLFAGWQLETFDTYDLKAAGEVLVLAAGRARIAALYHASAGQPAPAARWSGFGPSPAPAASLTEGE